MPSAMTLSPLAYGLLALLAIALVTAMVTDIRARIIPNKLNAAVALAAPLFWFAMGEGLWPDVAIHLLCGVIVFAFFLLMFKFGLMQGGDVKLLVALSLWLDWQQVYNLILFSSLIGIGITLIFWALHRIRKAEGPPEVPFGIAIALAGLIIISERYFNHFA